MRLVVPWARTMPRFWFLLSQHGGIVPTVFVVARHSAAHTGRTVEEISRGLASGASIREIARGLDQKGLPRR